MRGVPGHQEIELALLRLYDATGEKRYLETARYFLEERGTEPDYFTEERARIGWRHFGPSSGDRNYAQIYAPVKQQTKAVGHSVRAGYMYTAMAHLAPKPATKNCSPPAARCGATSCSKRCTSPAASAPPCTAGVLGRVRAAQRPCLRRDLRLGGP